MIEWEEREGLLAAGCPPPITNALGLSLYSRFASSHRRRPSGHARLVAPWGPLQAAQKKGLEPVRAGHSSPSAWAGMAQCGHRARALQNRAL